MKNPSILPDADVHVRDGREYVLFMDGNKWCAVWPDFRNLQVSPSGFGKTVEGAMQELDWNEKTLGSSS